jgi:hypothetical protein
MHHEAGALHRLAEQRLVPDVPGDRDDTVPLRVVKGGEVVGGDVAAALGKIAGQVDPQETGAASDEDTHSLYTHR